MTKNLLSWMAAGLGGLLTAVYQYLSSGHEVSWKGLLGLVATTLLLRAAQWVVANLGPQPAA